MSRARRSVRVKPATVDGHSFASVVEALRYDGLKAYAGATLACATSTDGRMLVCTWGDGLATPKRTQAFGLHMKATNKFNAIRTTINGITFASRHEARRWVELQRLQAAGVIQELTRQRRYGLVVNDVHIGSYTSDFEYRDVKTQAWVVEDAKSEATCKARDYPLRKKLMLACHGIAVQEIA